MAELQAERDEARNQADSMVLASDKLSQELVKVHEQYDDVSKRKAAEKAELAGDEPGTQWGKLAEVEDKALKTSDMENPCSLTLSVWKEQNSGKFQLRTKDEKGTETRIAITDELLEELDRSDPENEWADLFSRVGLSSDDTPKIVLHQLLGQKEVEMPPNGAKVLCRVHKFDQHRYYVSGTSLATTFMADYVITKDELEAIDDVSSAIKSGANDAEVVDVLLSKMSFKDEAGGFSFGEE